MQERNIFVSFYRSNNDIDFPSKLPEIFALLQQSTLQSASDFFVSVLKYIASTADTLDSATLRQAVKQSIPESGEQLVATLAEKWFSEGLEKGLEKGIEKGREEGLEEGWEKGATGEARSLLLKQIALKFGIDKLPDSIYQKINLLLAESQWIPDKTTRE